MKTVKLSSIAFTLLCLFSSCTKDAQQVTQSDENSAAAKSVVLGGPNTQGNNDVKPEMTITYSPIISNNPPTSTRGTEVTVTGSITSTPVPDCGKLQLQQNQNGNWVTVTQINLSATVHEVSYKFTPDTLGTYQFQVHYVPGGQGGNCTGFAQNKSSVFPLVVVEPQICNGLDITGKVTNAVPVAGTNLYKFTVVYEVSTCGLEFNKLKVQGGLTNATDLISGQDSPAAGVYDNWIPGGSSNWIQRWVETAASGSLLHTNKRTYTVNFTKAYSGTGNIELTGEWSVSLSLKAGGEAKDTVEKLYYTK